eukprot:1127474-Pelagomonas_calceolata.AAC.1
MHLNAAHAAPPRCIPRPRGRRFHSQQVTSRRTCLPGPRCSATCYPVPDTPCQPVGCQPRAFAPAAPARGGWGGAIVAAAYPPPCTDTAAHS